MRNNYHRYCFLKGKLIFSQKLKRRINFTSGSFAFAPFQLFQHISCPAISHVQTSTKLFQHIKIVCSNNTLRICFLFITPQVAFVPFAIFFTFQSSISSNKLRLPAFLKVGLSTLHLAFQEFTMVIYQLNLAYLDENCLMPDAVPQTFAYMPISFLLFQEQPFGTLRFARILNLKKLCKSLVFSFV